RRPAARIWRAERRHMRLERAPVQGVLAPLGPQLAPLVVLSADVRVVGGHVGKSCHATSYSPTHAVGPCHATRQGRVKPPSAKSPAPGRSCPSAASERTSAGAATA